MTATLSADFNFVPQVWQDHIHAYFRRKLQFGMMAVINDELKNKPGETVAFPYFKATGDAEDLNEDESMNVDKLGDDSFTATVKEVGKAVSIKKAAFMKSSATQEEISQEIQDQIARRIAEKVDKDLLTEMAANGNFINGFTATAGTDYFNVRRFSSAIISGLGDRHDEVEAVFIHSKQLNDLLIDSTSGFLQANAIDPMYNVKGFKGRLLGAAVFVNDSMPQGAVIGGVQSYRAFAVTAAPYGIMVKQDFEMEFDKDILAREFVFAATQWYAVKSFHSKISTQNTRCVEIITTTSIGG